MLDAICYALYGTVPGTRQGGKRLRSDHAPEGLEPQVVCEFSSGGRWMEVVRSPAWERPAKRGAGTTTQNAKTLLREKENGSWTEKSIRADEAGSEISALLGMNMDQFTKVVLLAQGDFAAFLRAKADDRQELLQKLFGTELYENVEKQLAAEAAAAKEELAGKEQHLWQLEESARAQAADIAAPDQGPDSVPAAGRPTGQDAGAVRPAEDEARGERFFEVLLERLADACGRAQKAAAVRHQDRLASAAACVSAQELMSRHQKLRTAVAERDRLAGLVPQFEQWQQRAQEHREAEVLAGQLAALSASRERLAGAETTAARIGALLAADEQTLALAGLGGPAGGTGVLSVADLRGAQSRLDREGAVVEADLPAEDRLDSLRAELAVLSDEVRDARDAAAKHTEAADAAQAQCQALRPGVEGLRELAGAVAARKQASTGAAQLLETIEAFGRARAQAAACEANHLQDHERLLNARELWLSLVERRLESAAGEMAARLVDGEPCQVCGSAVHPRPSALAGAGLEAAEAEEQAKIARDRAEAAEAGSAAKLAAARQELAVLQGRGGDADAGSARASGGGCRRGAGRGCGGGRPAGPARIGAGCPHRAHPGTGILGVRVPGTCRCPGGSANRSADGGGAAGRQAGSRQGRLRHVGGATGATAPGGRTGGQSGCGHPVAGRGRRRNGHGPGRVGGGAAADSLQRRFGGTGSLTACRRIPRACRTHPRIHRLPGPLRSCLRA